MIDLTRVRSLGDSVAEYLETLPGETDGEGESLFRIVPAGRSFGFQGEDLAEFVSLCVRRLLESGALPVIYAKEGKLQWAEQTHYGATPQEVSNAIVSEWLRNGGGQPDWSDVWFVTRGVLESSER